MGHTDLASTMRYLRPARGEKVQALIEALQLTTLKACRVVGPPIVALRPTRNASNGVIWRIAADTVLPDYSGGLSACLAMNITKKSVARRIRGN
jgi:hypothetical protein